MENIKKFLNDFFEAEANALNATIRPDLDFARKEADIMYGYCIKELYNQMDVVPPLAPYTTAEYEDFKNFPPANKRQLFKISHYNNPKYTDLFIVYVSKIAPKSNRLKIGSALFVATINDELKIVRSFFFGGDSEVPVWNPSSGDREVSFDTAGKLIGIERILEPKNDPFSIQEYKEDR